MSKSKKLLERFLSKPRDFSFDELRRLLKGFGYSEDTAGRTSGSRVTFVDNETKHIIRLHRPHPSPNLKRYQLDYIEETLRQKGAIK